MTPEHPKHCLRQYSDQMTCRKCGKTWDVDDPEPPECEDKDDAPVKRQ